MCIILSFKKFNLFSNMLSIYNKLHYACSKKVMYVLILLNITAYSLSNWVPPKIIWIMLFVCCSLQKECNEDCNFKELILENHYNTYASAKWTHSGGEMFVALNQKGVPVRGKKTKKEQKTAHFLPMAIT